MVSWALLTPPQTLNSDLKKKGKKKGEKKGEKKGGGRERDMRHAHQFFQCTVSEGKKPQKKQY